MPQIASNRPRLCGAFAATFSRFAWTRPVGERMVLVVEILRALSYLHRRGIVHRDLKPGNVLVDASGRVRVLDFGLSMARGTDRRIAGTVSYMAPEVLRGEGVTEASDLYAVGVMAFEILAGVRPFNGPDTQSIVSSVLRDEPDFASMSRAVDSAEALTPLPDPPSHVDAGSTALPESSTRDSDTRSGATVSRAEAVQSGGPAAAPAGAPAEPAAPAATLVEVVRRLLAKQPGGRARSGRPSSTVTSPGACATIAALFPRTPGGQGIRGSPPVAFARPRGRRTS